jgi:oligopeptide transport system substrate-binding protein
MILEQAAVLGRVFDLPTLEVATALDEESLIEALEEALVAQLIEEEAGSEETFSFIHALIPSSLVAGLRTLRRRRLQRRAASAFETIHPDNYEVLAHLFLDAGQINEGSHYLLLAGDRARVQYAHEEAIDSYRAAIDYLKEEGQLAQAARALMKLGLAYNNAFDFARSRQAYQEGFALWQQTSKSPSAGPSHGPSQPAPHPLRLPWDEPPSLDPGLTSDVVSISFIEQLFSGLLQLTVEMDIVPDVARSWEILDDERRYRFHLRDDVFWSDGERVTAADFAFAWKRVLAPEHGSPNAESLFTIKNGRDFHEGSLTVWDGVGVNIVDTLTLEVTLENPDSTFLYLMCQAFAFGVPAHRAPAFGLGEHGPSTSGARWMAWDELVTNGPFRLVEWERGKKLLLETNPGYHGSRSGNVESVELLVIPGESEERLALYEADRLDTTSLRPVNAVQGRNRFAGDHLLIPNLSTGYLGFDTRRAPFADPRPRRALALATDRERLSDTFSGGLNIPATGGLVPPGMPGHEDGIALPYDPEGARRLLAEAGYGERGAFPAVELLISQNAQVYEYLATQWVELLGIEIEVVELTWSAFL